MKILFRFDNCFLSFSFSWTVLVMTFAVQNCKMSLYFSSVSKTDWNLKLLEYYNIYVSWLWLAVNETALVKIHSKVSDYQDIFQRCISNTNFLAMKMINLQQSNQFQKPIYIMFLIPRKAIWRLPMEMPIGIVHIAESIIVLARD